MRFLAIMTVLFAYTSYKVNQLSSLHLSAVVGLVFLFFIFIMGPMFFSRARPESFHTKHFMIMTWLGYTLMGFWGTYIMISIPVDIFELAFSIFSIGKFPESFLHWLVFGVSILMSIFGFIEVLRGPKVVNVDVPIENLQDGLRNFRIAQISDLHIGPTIQSRYVRRVVEKVNAVNPDIIVITGDLVDAHTESILRHLQPLKDLKCRHGIYYVTGNHEYYWGVQKLLPELQKIGMTVLINSHRIVDLHGAKILIAGIPDPVGKQFSSEHTADLMKARTSDIHSDLNILLAHRPDPHEKAEAAGFHLQLSGHTHAGQFFPFSLLIPIAHKYYRGLNRYKLMWLYINPGTGYWGPANRFGIASEISLLKIIRSE